MKSNADLLEELTVEVLELKAKFERLYGFVSSKEYQELSRVHKHLLLEQAKAMYAYMITLSERVEDEGVKSNG